MARRKPNKGKSRSKSWEDKESRDMKRDEKRSFRSKSNDPAWYGADPALLRDAASIAFSWPLGRSLSIGVTSDNKLLRPDQPGVATFHVVPAIGEALSITSPINVASQAMYSFIRHANSGSKNYDSPDLMMYCLAMSDIYSALNWAIRAYGCAQLYNQKNRFMPREVLLANKVDPDSLINNLANYRLRLNVLINKVASLAVPGNMTVFNRKAFLYQNLYCESTDIKDQLYQFTPDAFYQFSLDEEVRGYLKCVDIDTLAGREQFANDPFTWDEVLNVIQNLMQAVWDQEDFGIMSGDILRAYGDNIIKLASVNEDYMTLPVYDITVLTQMKNATIVSQGITQVPNIEQDSTYAYLQYQQMNGATFRGHRVGQPAATDVFYDKLMTIPSEAPTPEEVIEASRLMVTYDQIEGYDYHKMNLYCGTELITKVNLRFLYKDGTFVEWTLSKQFYTSDEANITNMMLLGHSAGFKFLPAIWIVNGTIGAGDDYRLGTDAETVLHQNLDNFALIRNQDLRKMHEAAILNMLNVPSIAKNAISQR